MAMKGLNYPTKDELSYSTTEQGTGMTWIDGKAIYKKTVNIGALPNATNKDVNHGISDIDLIIRMEGFATDNDRTFFLSSPAIDSEDSWIRVVADKTKISIKVGTDRTSYSGYVTLYYTKVEEGE